MSAKCVPFPPPSVAAQRRRFWARIFAGGVQQTRVEVGRSIAEAAELAGMEVSEWAEIEAGLRVPHSEVQLRAMAGALEISFDRLASLTFLCSDAWNL